MKIKLQRVEGSADKVGNLSIVNNFAQADEVLKAWSDSAPAEGGFDKCDFSIQLDGDCIDYNGRYELVHWRVRFPDLKQHILRRLGNMRGPDAVDMAVRLKDAA